MKGTGVALVTPFNDDNSVDFKGLADIIEHCISGGVEYLVALGTTGESVTLTKEEKKKIYAFIPEQAKGRVQCVAGIGGNITHEIIDTIKGFDFKGYDAVLSVSPYYNKPSQAGIVAHYNEVAKASPLPVILYNVPGRTGSNMSAETSLKIANENKNVIAVKEASGIAEQIMDIISKKPVHFEVISGDDTLTLQFMSVGMTGVISVIAQAYPKEFSEMVRLALKGDFTGASKLHYKIYEVTKSIYLDGNPGGIKALLSQMGLCKNILRMPLVPVRQDVFDKINACRTGTAKVQSA